MGYVWVLVVALALMAPALARAVTRKRPNLDG
jgi:hypothetical protein